MGKTNESDKAVTVRDGGGAATGTALTEDQQKQLVANAEFEEFAGSGFENQTSDDYSIPFINILQALSPQLQERDDLKAGMLFNTVTGEAFKGSEGIAFIPATTRHQFVEFKPRDQGGGFVAAYEINDPLVKAAQEASTEFGKYSTPAGNELIETFYVYGIAIDAEGNTSDAVIAFNSTKIKKYKAWQTKAKTIQIALPSGKRIPAPLWAHRYRLKSVQEKNNKGSFHNFDIAFDGENAQAARLMPSDPLAVDARDLIAMIDSGKARAAHESTTAPADDGADGGKPVF